MLTNKIEVVREVRKAILLSKTLGFRTAASYLRNCGFTLGESLYLLNLPNRYNFA
jgi:hypothetical protein